MLTLDQRREFETDGFTIVPLFSEEECDRLTDHYMALRETEWPGDFAGVDPTSEDPLKRYPRMIHMHRWDAVSLEWAVDSRLNAVMTELLGQEPYMVQTMLYFKPPGARGQALHQDQAYLRAQPGTCMAAWLALDDADEENGCMQMVRGTKDLPILCPEKADISWSFTDVQAPIPEGMSPEPAIMKRGEVLFFNGQVIHGSYPNRSATRFRRALIGHYVTGDAERVYHWYHPVYRMDGSIVEFGQTEEGGPCGVWVDHEGQPVVEMIDPSERVEVPAE